VGWGGLRCAAQVFDEMHVGFYGVVYRKVFLSVVLWWIVFVNDLSVENLRTVLVLAERIGSV
jgi:hypothetical protein